jgi:hypothetical protein
MYDFNESFTITSIQSRGVSRTMNKYLQKMNLYIHWPTRGIR